MSNRPAVRKPASRKVDLAPSNALETARSAEQSTTNEPGYCLQWSREQAEIPAVYPDAATAWRGSTGKRPGDRNPPVGAAVYWTGGSEGYGHIAISVGDGRVRSTDAGGPGQVATVRVDWLTRRWGLRYAGWSDSINGYTIPGVDDPDPDLRDGEGDRSEQSTSGGATGEAKDG